jgi:HTH-type transcriptional regulator/antitoxin HigA
MRTKTKSLSPPGGLPCFECEEGRLQSTIEDYTTYHPSRGEMVVPDVPMLRCDRCGELVIGDEGNRKIDAWLDKELNAISPQEIQAFLTKYQLTQKQASEITGLGEKNISRWLSGHTRPSESVSNFLRVLLAEDSAFERLKTGNFDTSPKPVWPLEERQPDAEEKEILRQIDYACLVRVGAVKAATSPMARRTELCRFLEVPDLKAFGELSEQNELALAAFKDTKQQTNPMSGAIWLLLGRKAAQKVAVKPYDRDKLRDAVSELRELTQSPLMTIIPEVRRILAEAGVALVFAPIMKQSGFRGCTQLLTPVKAMIVHGLKYRNVSQFWLILFHEIAHLVLHISNPGDVIADYDDQTSDPREMEADEWARNTLIYSDKLIAFQARHPTPEVWQIEQFARELKVHTAIAAEVFNKRAKAEVIQYSRLNQLGLFPGLSEEEAAFLWENNSLGIAG